MNSTSESYRCDYAETAHGMADLYRRAGRRSQYGK
jgi:hypothetical protein